MRKFLKGGKELDGLFVVLHSTILTTELSDCHNLLYQDHLNHSIKLAGTDLAVPES